MNLWRVLGGLFTAIVLLVGGALLWSWFGPPSGLKTDTQKQTYSQPIGVLILNDFENADIVVTTGPVNTVTITRELRWSGTKPQFIETWERETLRVTAAMNCGFKFGDSQCAARYTITVPANVTIEAATSSGNVRVRGITSEIKVETASGDIEVNDTEGRLNLRSTSGDVVSSSLKSMSADVTTTSGDVNLRFSVRPTSVKATGTSGDINISLLPTGYQVRVQTVSGAQHVRVAEEGERFIDVQTVSGDVTVTG